MATQAVELWNINHGSVRGYREQMSRKKLKETILAHGDWLFRNGEKYQLRSKHIAAGVYNVWFEPADRPTERGK